MNTTITAGVHHVALTVSNVRRAQQFYSDLLASSSSPTLASAPCCTTAAYSIPDRSTRPGLGAPRRPVQREPHRPGPPEPGRGARRNQATGTVQHRRAGIP